MRAAVGAVLLFGGTVSAMGIFQRNHPRVEEGTRAYQKGDYGGALRSFDEAKKEFPDSAAVEFNRGNALYKLGRLDEAKQAYSRVNELDRGELREKDLYNLGNAWAKLGNDQAAIAAYRQALTLDPTDQAARHNLEVVLRKIPPPPDAGVDGGTDGGGDGGTDGGADGGRGDGGSDGGSDGGTRPGGNEGGDGGLDGGEKERQEKPDWNEGMNSDGGTAAQLTPEQVQRLLDSLKSDERNLQLWRFQRKSRKPVEKDW